MKEPLSVTHPEIAAQWHPTKNNGLTPDKVMAGSHLNIWWKCPKGSDHEWQATLGNRTKKVNPTGCPCCRGQKVSVTNSLASLFPAIASEWHPTKNENLRPEDMVAGSNKLIWWKCPKGSDHEWQTKLVDRTKAINPTGCPYCSGKKVSMTNSLATLFPEIAGEWHPIRNGDIKPNEIVAGSAKKVWWKCPQGPDHEWQATLTNRIRGTNCPFCAGKAVSVTNSLASLFPELVAEWHPTKNAPLDPARLVAGSHLNVWWKCPQGPDHEWQTTLDGRTNRYTGCPYCVNQKVSSTNSLATRFPELISEWHPTKNGELTPYHVISGSHLGVWWKCSQAYDHEWKAKISDRTRGTGCPYCRGLKVAETNRLATLFPAIAREWHPTRNGSLKPEDIVAGSNKLIWWKCPKGPDHEWRTKPASRTKATNPTNCPYCAGREVSITNSLMSLFPNVAREWHPTKNHSLTPDAMVAGSNKRVWWQCPVSSDHQWECTVANRTWAGNGCPFCRSLKVSVTNSLASLFPKLVAEWHPTKNDGLTPEDVAAGSEQKVWWLCKNGIDHEWQATLSNRTKKVNPSGCPCCAGYKVSVTNSLAALFPDVAAEWHPTKNGETTPDQIV